MSIPLKNSLAPRMPKSVESIIQYEYNDLDPGMENILQWMRDQKTFNQFAHGRDPFIVHLRGTWEVLRNWDQPYHVARCGLFHSSYSKLGFNFRYFDINKKDDRKMLASVIGDDAEHLVWQYCHHAYIWDVRESFGPKEIWKSLPGNLGKMEINPNYPILGEPLNPNGYDIPSIVNPSETIHFTPEEIANYFVVFAADVIDQFTDVTSYSQIYTPGLSVNGKATRIWPGTGKPGMMSNSLGFAFFSRMLYTARDYLKVVPPVFNNCTVILDQKDEKEARDLYWDARRFEHEKSDEELEAMYRKSAELNPWVAETHIMLSQLLYKREAWSEAAEEGVKAIKLLYDWGTHWDKQISYAQWVGFARMCHMRAKRREAGLKALPSQAISPEARKDAQEVTYLQDIMAEFEKYTVPESLAEKNGIKQKKKLVSSLVSGNSSKL